MSPVSWFLAFVGVLAFLFSHSEPELTGVETPCMVKAGNVVGGIPVCDASGTVSLRCDVYEWASLMSHYMERRDVVCVCGPRFAGELCRECAAAHNSTAFPSCNSTAELAALAPVAPADTLVNVGAPSHMLATLLNLLSW